MKWLYGYTVNNLLTILMDDPIIYIDMHLGHSADVIITPISVLQYNLSTTLAAVISHLSVFVHAG